MVKYPKLGYFILQQMIDDQGGVNMKIREMPHWEMPREKLLHYGTQNLSTAELLAILKLVVFAMEI